MASETYRSHFAELEAGLAQYAFTSEKATLFLDGTEVHQFYEDKWQKSEERGRLTYRTPLSIERDRILYSDEMRRLTDKYHVLFQGSDRILRNYTTQTLRTAHVARVIAQALRLNAEFAEALALGAKVGAVPFVHCAKVTADQWIKDKVAAIDNAQPRQGPTNTSVLQRQLFQDDPDVPLPGWVAAIDSKATQEKVARFIPWAAGEPAAEAYSSGKQSYWLLSTDPFLRRPKSRAYLPQTMHGIWRHSRGQTSTKGAFVHRSPLWETAAHYTGITADHATHEEYVVQYADDITWVVENLNDANTAAALAGRGRWPVYHELSAYLSRQDAPEMLLNRINAGDSGGIYTYFIADMVATARAALGESGTASPVLAPEETPRMTLSPVAEQMLSVAQEFLETNVFMDSRVSNRNRMLEAITKASLDILYEGERGLMERFLDRRGRTHGWIDLDRRAAEDLLGEPVHRVQLAVDIFASMSDEEVYDFSGLEAV